MTRDAYAYENFYWQLTFLTSAVKKKKQLSIMTSTKPASNSRLDLFDADLVVIPPNGGVVNTSEWESTAGKKVGKCVIHGCGENATAGRVVKIKRKGEILPQKYIVPTCEKREKCLKGEHTIKSKSVAVKFTKAKPKPSEKKETPTARKPAEKRARDTPSEGKKKEKTPTKTKKEAKKPAIPKKGPEPDSSPDPTPAKTQLPQATKVASTANVLKNKSNEKKSAKANAQSQVPSQVNSIVDAKKSAWNLSIDFGCSVDSCSSTRPIGEDNPQPVVVAPMNPPIQPVSGSTGGSAIAESSKTLKVLCELCDTEVSSISLATHKKSKKCEKNKKDLKESLKCSCGSSVTRGHFARHRKACKQKGHRVT